jgi:hypothetical protein
LAVAAASAVAVIASFGNQCVPVLLLLMLLLLLLLACCHAAPQLSKASTSAFTA